MSAFIQPRFFSGVCTILGGRLSTVIFKSTFFNKIDRIYDPLLIGESESNESFKKQNLITEEGLTFSITNQ